MPNIKLLDVDTKIMYTLEVSEEDAKQANEDASYATQLLQIYLEKGHNDLSESEVKKSAFSTSPTSSTPCVDTSCVETKEEKTVDSSSKKSNYQDGYRWSHDAILALFDVYKAEQHAISSGISLKKFWTIVSTKLKERGFYINDIQCKTKMAGLRITYKNMKHYNEKSIYNCRKWRYFEIMDEMYKKNPWVSAVFTTKAKFDSTQSTRLTRSTRFIKPKYDNNENNEDDEDKNNENNVEKNVEKPSSSPFKPEPSSRRTKQLDRIISVIEENTIERKRMHQESIIRQDKLLDILEKIYRSTMDKDEAYSSGSSSNKNKRAYNSSAAEKLITVVEETISKRSKMHEDVMTRQDKLINALEKLFEK